MTSRMSSQMLLYVAPLYTYVSDFLELWVAVFVEQFYEPWQDVSAGIAAVSRHYQESFILQSQPFSLSQPQITHFLALREILQSVRGSQY